MMKSPFTISKEAQIKRNKEKSEAFYKEYKELCKKHGLSHSPRLQPTPNALLAINVLVEYTEDERNTEG